MRWPIILLLAAAPLAARESERGPGRDIEILRKQAGTAEGRAAWERVAAGDAAGLVELLRAMSTANTAGANWLRTAFDRIVQRELSSGGKAIPIDDLLRFATTPEPKNGRARRLALDLLEELRPGTSAKLFPGWLEDPEFRYEAVASVITQGKRAFKQGIKSDAEQAFRRAFAASRDVVQAREAAAGLEQLGVKVSVAAHLGFLMDWRLIGPFDGGGQKGYAASFPPEKSIDLDAELPGQGGKKLRWVRYRAEEPAPAAGARHQALVNLRDKEALGDADDAVAYAYTEFSVSQPLAAEMRGAADDNFSVWVNGHKVFGFEEWRNGVRHDRHRFPVELKAGTNTVLVKVCQTPAPNPEPNWEFFLRVVDASGKGIEMKNVLR